MKKKLSIIPEGLPENATESDVTPFMRDLDPPQGFMWPEYTQLEGETDLDYDTRRAKDILVQFYEVGLEKISSPIEVGPGVTRPGLSITLQGSSFEVILSIDYPVALLEFLAGTENSKGCRLSLIVTQLGEESQDAPNPVKALPKFFKDLPANLSYAPWQKSPLSAPGMAIYEAILIGQEKLHYHLAADSLARVLDWLHEMNVR